MSKKDKAVILFFSEEEHELLKKTAKKTLRSANAEAKLAVLEHIAKENGYVNISEYKMHMEEERKKQNDNSGN